MREPLPHIIHRFQLSLDLEQAPTAEHALLLDRLAALGNGLLPQLLEEGLNAEVPSDMFKRLERLELELSVDHLDDLPQAIRRQFPEVLRKALGEYLHPTFTSGKKAEKGSLPLGPLTWLVHFLRFGSLPAAAPRHTSPDTLGESCSKLLRESPAWQLRIRQLISENEAAFRRVLAHWGPAFLWALLPKKILTTERASSFTAWQESLQYSVFEKQGVSAQFRFWQKQFAEASAKMPKTEQAVRDAVSSPVSPKVKVREMDAKAEEVLYIEDAGLILLHPFLTTYFQQLGWEENEQPQEIGQAAAVLFSLVWGHSPTAEWQLVLAKLLLGLPLTQVLAVHEVTPVQLELGEELIKAAIAHWSVLGSTTVEGFRESFLQRPGRLSRTPEGWSLVLEQRPYDMLLEQLPWQIGYIKLPWMTDLIRTEL